MKVRQGFVSNSSSSSFIIGVGKVIDEDKITSYCKENGIDFEIMTVKEILEYKGWSSVKRERQNKTFFVNKSFDGSDVSCEIDVNALDEKYISVDYCQDIDESEDGDTNYNVDPDDFGETGSAIFGIGEQNGVTKFDSAYGAGRNG